MAIDKPVAVREAELDWVDIGVRPGYNQKYKGFFDEGRNLAARVGSLYAQPYYHSPRHKHTFQQVRFLVSGQMRYGNEIYEPGDFLYIPEGAAYGPVKPLADATPESPGMHFVDIQFQGPSGVPYPEPETVVQVREQLSEEGAFEEGIYTGADGRKKDAYEAILGRIMGQDSITYPRPVFADYIVARSSQFPWTPLQGVAGIQVRHLGHFTESGPSAKVVHLDAGAELPAGTAAGHQVRFLIEGAVEFAGEKYDPISFVMLPDGADYDPLRATTESTLLTVAWRSGLREGESPIPFDYLTV